MSQTPSDRKDRPIREKRHDSYHKRGKTPASTRYPGCGAFYTGGRGTWAATAEKTPPHSSLFPAGRGIGEALPRVYKGDLPIQYAEQEQSVRLYWRR